MGSFVFGFFCVFKVHIVVYISISLVLLLNNISLYGYTTFHLLPTITIHQLIDFWIVSTFRPLCYYEHSPVNPCVDVSFHFSWMYT